MVRMSDSTFPFMTLSLSLATSSSSGPRGSFSGSTHHGLNREIKDQPESFSFTKKTISLMFLHSNHEHECIFAPFEIILEPILTLCSKKSQIFASHYFPIIITYMVEKFCHHKQEGSSALWELVLNIPEAKEELVLQQYGEDEEDNAFSCHCKQVFSYKVPLKRVQSLLCAWKRRTYF